MFDKKALKNLLLLIYHELELKSGIYILKKKKSQKLFNVPAILLKYINSNTISLKIKINYNEEIK